MRARLAIIFVLCVLFIGVTSFRFVQAQENGEEQNPQQTLMEALVEALFGKGTEAVPDNEYVPDRLQKVLNDALSGTPFPEDVNLEELLTETEDGPSGGAFYEDEEFAKNYQVASDNSASYGLTQPSQEVVNGLYEQLKSDPLHVWARDCLYYEKYLKSKGMNVKPYLLCAWVWFEGMIDPNGVNCKDNSDTALKQNASAECSNFEVASRGDGNAMMQVGGYQVFDQAASDNFNKVFNLCHKPENFNRVLNRAYDESGRSINPRWSYPAQKDKELVAEFIGEIDSVKTDVIGDRNEIDLRPDRESPPYSSESSAYKEERRKHFFTILLGKDPCMRVGLNVSATANLVSDIANKGWASYVRKDITLLTGRLEALRKFDEEIVVNEIRNSSYDGNETNIASGGASFNGDFGKKQFQQFCQCGAEWNQGGNDDICMSGCGLTTMAFIFSNLGSPTKPTETYNEFKGQFWRRAVGMETLEAALRSDFVRLKGFKIEELKYGIGSLNVNDIAEYFEGARKGKCLVFGSQKKVDANTFNHIFPIVDVDTQNNKVDVRDTWRLEVCKPRANRVISNVQPPSYVNNYYIAVCKE